MSRMTGEITGVLAQTTLALCSCALIFAGSCDATAADISSGSAGDIGRSGSGYRRAVGRAASVERVLLRYIDAVGGRKALGRLKTRTIKGTFTKDLHWDEPPYENYLIVIFTKSDGRMLLDEHRPGGRRREGFDGESNWIGDDRGVEIQEGFYLRKLAWICNPQGALRVEQFFPGLSVNEDKSGEDSAFYVLEPHDLPPEHYALYFDKKSGLLTRIGYYWDIEDYREVDGVLVPHRIIASRKGGSCTYQFDEIRNNAPVDDSIFSPPGGAVY